MSKYFTWKKRTIGVVKTLRLDIRGLEHIPDTGAAIIAPNHVNWKDIFFLSAVITRQIHFIGTYELFDTHRCYEYCLDYIDQKVGKWFKFPAEILSRSMANIISHRVREVGAIPVNRVGYVKRMFESVEKNLKIGKLVCIFPEGGTGFAGKLKKFKKGLAKIVYDLHQEGYHKIPVIPAAIKGTEKFYFPNRKLSLTLGFPLHIDDYMMHSQQETLIQFTEQLWRAVHDLLFESKSND